MEEVYICHEYHDKNHFNAIYKYAEKNGYRVVDYIVIEKQVIIKTFIKTFILHHKPLTAILELLDSLKKIQGFKKIENKIIIVGIAPYNKLMLSYKDVFSKNKCIYFSSWQFWNGDAYPRGSIKYREAFERILHNHFIAAACVTERTSNGLSHIIDRTVIVNHSIPIEEYTSKESMDDYTNNKYIYLGRFDENKNIKLILTCMERFKDIDIELHFAGWGKLEREVRKAAKRDSRIEFLGKLTKDEIKNRIHEYKYLVLCSSYETFGIVLIEALSAGVPCIVSDALGPREIIKNEYNGFMFLLNDGVDGFQTALRKSIELAPFKYKEMSDNCIRCASLYSEKNVFEKWKSLFELSLCDQSGIIKNKDGKQER